MKKNQYIPILSLLLLSISLKAQTDYSSFWKEVGRKESIYRDSLRAELRKRPAIIDLELEIDRQKVELKENFAFWYEKNGAHFRLKKISNTQFLIDTVSDTLSFVLLFDNDTLRFNDIGFGWMRHGADFRFGIMNELNEIRKYYRKHRKDEDFDKWVDIGEPYIRLVENKRLMRQINKVKSIYFLIIIPEVVGDPAMLTITRVIPKCHRKIYRKSLFGRVLYSIGVKGDKR